jgi:hypothetical protein
MGLRSKVALAALGIAFTFTFGASAGTLTVQDDEASPPLPSSPALIPAPTSFTKAEIGEPPPAQPRVELDPNDPWSSKRFAITRAPKRSKPRPLDTMDPWGSASERAVTPPSAATPPSTPSTPSRAASDDALREAIKRALDAGDLDRAAKLLEILRTPR